MLLEFNIKIVVIIRAIIADKEMLLDCGADQRLLYHHDRVSIEVVAP